MLEKIYTIQSKKLQIKIFAEKKISNFPNPNFNEIFLKQKRILPEALTTATEAGTEEGAVAVNRAERFGDPAVGRSESEAVTLADAGAAAKLMEEESGNEGAACCKMEETTAAAGDWGKSGALGAATGAERSSCPPSPSPELRHNSRRPILTARLRRKMPPR